MLRLSVLLPVLAPHSNPRLAELPSPAQPPVHPFSQICKGATKEERLQWCLPEGTAFSWLPNPESSLEEDCFEVTREAMLHLGIDTPTQNNIFKVLAGLLHLGNVHFVDSEDEAQPCQLMDGTKGERRGWGMHLVGMTSVSGLRWEIKG